VAQSICEGIAEDLVFALKNFRRNKIRTILSLLGVIIGVASVIIITSLGKSAGSNIKKSFGSSGLDLVRLNSPFMSRRNRTQAVTFDAAFKNDIFAAVPDIKKVWYINTFSAALNRENDTSLTAQANAVEYGYLEMCNLKLDYGEFFSVSDAVLGSQKLILGYKAALGLFPDGNAAGQKLVLVNNSVPFGFTVSGVLAEQTAGFEDAENGVYVPRGFYLKKISPEDKASVAVLQATGAESAAKLTENAKSFVTMKTGDEYSVSVTSMQSMFKQFEEVTGTVSLLLSGIAAISLLVGGIGIMNIMIVTVTERKKEIGIRKAIGAAPSAIRLQFLVESASITLFGGIIGIALGILISAAAVFVLNWSFSVQIEACVLAFVFSAFVGVFFGFNPASRAAKLDPIEALASE